MRLPSMSSSGADIPNQHQSGHRFGLQSAPFIIKLSACSLPPSCPSDDQVDQPGDPSASLVLSNEASLLLPKPLLACVMMVSVFSEREHEQVSI